MHGVVIIRRLDHVVLLVALEPVLWTEGGGDVEAASNQRVERMVALVARGSGLVVLALYTVAAKHLVRLTDEAFCFGNAGSQRLLACLNFARLLVASLGPFFPVRHRRSASKRGSRIAPIAV